MAGTASGTQKPRGGGPGGRDHGRPGGRSARRRAREYALQGLYQWLVGGQEAAAIEAHLREHDENHEFDTKCDVEHFREVLRGTIDAADGLRAEFIPYIDRPVAELSPVEHAILLIGAYELKHRPEIPYRVVINEAVELAKSFGGTDGFRYVNGVLDRVAASLRPHEAGRS